MRDSIDVLTALRLRRAGMSWPNIGKALANDKGRKMAYQPRAVADAVKDFCKQRGINFPKLDGYGS